MLDHFGWKWWKKQDADIDQVMLELVDIWHFGLSELLRADALDDGAAIALSQVEPAQNADAESFRKSIEALAVSSLQTQSFAMDAFLDAMRNLPMSYGQLYGLYIGKNVLNQFRQNNGYQDGGYRKLWHGREDNEHLVELLADLSDSGAELPRLLYAALNERYQQDS